jgi:Bifunctional DNA primase/polymerase, N-terminal
MSPTIAQAAVDYNQRRKWKPVPVSRKTKKPIGKEWQKRPFNPAQFNGNAQNIAIQLGEVSGGLVDVDLDSMAAIGLAPEFLPQTDCIFGRRSKPCSHQLYVCDLHKIEPRAVIPYAQIVNGRAGPMIVELRVGGNGKGATTVVPPSMHETGETVEWALDGKPARVDAAELIASVRKLAIAALLKSYYPGQGSRHEGALVIGGVLARVGWTADDIAKVVTAAARAAGDDDVRGRVTTAVGAIAKKANGEDVAGFKRLREVWGDIVGDTLAHWFKADAKKGKQFMAGKAKWACNVGNIELALETVPEFMNLVRFDEMLRTEILLRPIKGINPKFKPRPLTDGDVTELQARLQWFGFQRLGKDTVHDAVNAHARAHSFHPVRDYLNGLK